MVEFDGESRVCPGGSCWTPSPGRAGNGADPKKLKRQFEKFGISIDGIPPLLLQRGTDGEFVIFDGVTRATRVAKYLPGIRITGEVIGKLNGAVGNRPTIRETL